MAEFYDTLEEFMENEIPEFINWAERASRRGGSIARPRRMASTWDVAGRLISVDDRIWTPEPSNSTKYPWKANDWSKNRHNEDKLVDLVDKELSDI